VYIVEFIVACLRPKSLESGIRLKELRTGKTPVMQLMI
jgi:hypothetical protein